MPFNKMISRYVFSMDFILSLIFTGTIFSILIFTGNESITLSVVEKLTHVGITVFSVLFPLFFAALSIIISSSDDEFSKFLQERGYYQEIIKTFKFTLLLIFISFIYSIIFFSTVNVLFETLPLNFFYYISISYMFILLYSLFAAFTSIIDSIRYAERRGVFSFNKDRS